MKNNSRRKFLYTCSLALGTLVVSDVLANNNHINHQKRIGIIGLDTSHAIAFTKILFENQDLYKDYKVVAAYPYGTTTIPSATDRIPKYIDEIKKYDVEVVSSIDKLLQNVDFVFLETNDGRLHLEQAKKVFKAGKPVFIDKPLAASFADAKAIFKWSEKYKVPFFSTSSMRYIEGMEEIIAGKYGKVLGADVYSPATLEASHPDFSWYGIHGIEILYAAMGVGCKSVMRFHTQDTDKIVAEWEDGRIASVRGTRSGFFGFGGTIYCEQKTVTLGEGNTYKVLLEKVVDFFESSKISFDTRETLEIAAFIDAADLSKTKGKSILISEIVNAR